MASLLRVSHAALLLVLLASLAPRAVVAQTITAVVQGRVLDSSGAGVPGATITARNTETGARRTTTSDAEGHYRLAALQVGIYDITAELSGLGAQNRPGIVLRIGQEATIDFTMAVSGLKETVTVRGEAPIVETTRSALGGTITTQQIDELPVAERNFTNLAYMVPGILNSVNSENSDVTIGASGANGTGNTFLIDGLSNDADAISSTRGIFSLDAIAEYQVLTNQYAAEYGQASGAIINVVTRSGTNNFRGRAFGYYRADSLSANDPFVQPDPVTGEREKAPFSQKIFGGYLGGPIRQDKTFYFVSYDHTLREETAVVTVDPALLRSLGLPDETNIAHPTRRPLFLAKVDQQIGGNQTFTARYRFDKETEENGVVGGIFTSEVGADFITTNQDFALLHTWIISPTALNESRFQFARNNNDITQVACSGCPFIIRPSLYSGKNPSFPQAFVEDRLQFMDAVSINKGNHAIKTGVDVSLISLEGLVEQTFDGLFVFTTDAPFNAADANTYPLLFQQSTGDPSFNIDNTIFALFAQDQWRVTPQLTLNLGLRYDYESSLATTGDKNNLGPRLHFAWDPGKDGRTTVRGGYGRYYDQVFLNVVLFSALFNGTLDTTTLLFPGYPDAFVGGAGIPLPNPPPTIYRFQADLKTPYSDTFSLGVQREVAPDFAVNVDWVHARGRNLLALINNNYSVNGVPAPDANFSQVFDISSVGRMNYQALQLGLQKRLSDNYTFGLAYTLSDTKRNTDGHQFQPVDARDLEAEYGPSDNDARHTLGGSLNYQAPWDISVGLSGRGRSALPFTEETGEDDNQDSNFNDRPTGVGRNSRRGQGAWTIDARVSKGLQIGRTKLELVAEAFNLFNHTNRGEFNENRLSPQFGQPSEVAAGFPMRQIQLGARLEF